MWPCARRRCFSRARGLPAACTSGCTKRIPVCAGLGGGSSDAAAVLRALERLTGAGFTRTQLEEMGAEIGSDVPYCVAGGTVLAEGRGERLTPVTPMPRLRS